MCESDELVCRSMSESTARLLTDVSVAGCGRSGSAVLIALAPFLDTPLLASTGDSLLPPVPPPFDQDPYFKLLDTARECRSIIENKKQWMFVKEVGPKWAKRRVAL